MKLGAVFALPLIFALGCNQKSKLSAGVPTAAVEKPISVEEETSHIEPSTDPEIEQPKSTDAGVSVSKVGVNFEDNYRASGNDYNDAVLCFEGAFIVDGTSVKSLKAQSFVPRFESRAQCNLDLIVRVKRANQVVQEIKYNNKMQDSSDDKLNFEKGDVLDVSMYTVAGCEQGSTKHMSDTQHAVVAVDKCNDSGN